MGTRAVDRLAKVIAGSSSRRGVLGCIVMLSLAAPIAFLGPDEAETKKRNPKRNTRGRSDGGQVRAAKKKHKKKLPTPPAPLPTPSPNPRPVNPCVGVSCADTETCDNGICRSAACIPDTADLGAAIAGASVGAVLLLCDGTWVLPEVFDQEAGLVIAKDLTLCGERGGRTILDGGCNGRVIDVRGATVTLQDLTIRNGKNWDGLDHGGGIFNSGQLKLQRCLVTGNDAKFGGGIYNDNGATLLLHGTSVAENTGGGVLNYGGAVTLEAGSTVSGNAGGGIVNLSGNLTLQDDSRVTGNTAENGAGISNGEGTVTLQDSHVSNNAATNWGGGIYSGSGTATLQGRSTISGNMSDFGGGIYTGGNLTLQDDSIVSDNTANAGGGIYIFLQSVVRLEARSSVTGNTATISSGGILNSGRLTLLTDSRVTNNSAPIGGGILNSGILAIQDLDIVTDNSPDNCAGEDIPATCIG